jgi:hypothetical protein
LRPHKMSNRQLKYMPNICRQARASCLRSSFLIQLNWTISIHD